MTMFGGGMYNPYTVQYRIFAIKAMVAMLIGTLIWAWTEFDLEIPTGQPQPAVTQTQSPAAEDAP